ncbi:nucleotidyltransferase domain-containing protein [Labrenzia sp. VG12]|uniref:nucleotidyltransferase domain-containing protein n=1 Tax=Labrenzia sp. VG12 TaxID=2021862 RepID=UPI000B8C2E45|nr:nucleotidyltransferase domain-containing protein [Labrenzia sp. VG12]ASP35550.1 nucleotidyltransferase [Labrenzia sp. VG12]
MDPNIVAEIRRRLKALEMRETITIPLAIESGSRAWGFPSPDSDYDCRFVYVRAREKTVTLFPVRDVIEEPLTPVFDINGWDLAKALRLMHSGNAVIVEWLTSVFAYQLHEPFRDAALELAEAVCDRALIGKHYFHLAKAQIQRQDHFKGEVSLKKTLYVLRPLTALMWLSEHPDKAVAPMNFLDMRRDAGFPEPVSDAIDRLLVQKAESSEMGSDQLDPVLSAFILTLYERFEPWAKAEPPGDAHREEIDTFWRHWSDELCPRQAVVPALDPPG